jgi:patatin-like phospholipase/acyl hydrolase
MSYRDRAGTVGPKKLLALDGGGIRGVLTLEILAAIEDLLRHELGAGDGFVLADYFDYIAGTSTGAIVAAGLACGMRVKELQNLYAARGADMFDKAFIIKRFQYKYDSSRLQGLLQEYFGAETTFGGDRLRTLLMMVLRNASTDSPWPLSNNPRAKRQPSSRLRSLPLARTTSSSSTAA